MFFLYFLYTEKPVKFKKAICSFIFLFFPMLKLFSCRSKIFQNGSLGTKNGPSDPLKFLVSLEISKLGPLAHFYSLLNHFQKFSHCKKKFSHCKKRKINEQSTINHIYWAGTNNGPPGDFPTKILTISFDKIFVLVDPRRKTVGRLVATDFSGEEDKVLQIRKFFCLT